MITRKQLVHKFCGFLLYVLLDDIAGFSLIPHVKAKTLGNRIING